MADSIVRLRIDSQEYDANIKRAGDALKRYFDTVKQGGGTLAHLDEGVLDATKALGQLGTMANGTRASISEMTSAFTDFSMRYKQLTEEEKRGDVGKALRTSLDQLKGRIKDAKADLAEINQELYGGKFGQFGGIIDSIGKKMGVTGNLTEILTSKTALMTASIGAAAAAVYKGTEAWTKYNAELAKQDQTTTIVTGLDGTAANVMTDKMRALADTYRVDFRQAIEAANTLMSQFGKSGEEATQLIKDGMQGMLHGDGQKLLQMVQHYAPAFRDAGVSASQLIAVIHNSQGGIFTPENMNAIVMGIKNIRLMTKQTSEALAKLGLDGQDMARKMSDGSMSVFDALKQVAGKLKECEAGSQTTGEVMQAVFGRSGVTAGQNLATAIEGLNTNLEETKKQTGDVGQAFNDLQTAYEGLNTAIRDAFNYDGYQEMATGIKTELVNALAEVIEQLGKIKALWLGLSEGQAKKKLYGTSGIPDEVKRDLEALQNANEAEREQLYLQQRTKYEKRYGQATRQEQYERAWMNNEGESWWQRNNPLSLVGRWWFARNAKSAGNTVAAEADVMSEYNKAARQIVYGKKEESTNRAEVIKPYGGNGGSGRGTTEKTETELKQNEAAVAKLTEEYQKLATDAKTANDAQLSGIKERQSAIQAEIANLKKRNEELKRFAAEAQGIQVNIGVNSSLPDLTAKLKELQAAQSQALNGTEWQEYQKQIEQVSLQIDAMKGKWKDGMKATISVNTESIQKAIGESSKLQDLITKPKKQTSSAAVESNANNVASEASKLEDIITKPKTGKVTITADTTDAKAKVKEVDAMVGDKTMTVTANTAEAEDALSNIEGLTLQPKELDITADVQKVLDAITQIDGVTVDPKTLEITAGTAEAYAKLQELFANIEGTTVTFNVEPKQTEMSTGLSITTQSGMNAYISQLKSELAEADFGSDIYNSIAAKLTDMTSLSNLVAESLKAGLGTSLFDAADILGEDFWTRAMEGGVEDIDWQDIVNKINEKLQEMDLKPISLDFETGNVDGGKDEKGNEQKGANSNGLKQIVGNISTITGALQQLGVDVPEGFQKTLGVMQVITTILMALQSLSTITATSSALKSIPILGMFLHNGGVVHAANGYSVPGNTFSGDKVPAMLDSGELVLNKAAQGNLLSQLENVNNGNVVAGETRVEADEMVLLIRNGAARKGVTIGEYLGL